MAICCLKSGVVTITVLANALRDNLLARQKRLLLQTDQEVTRRTCRATIPLDKRVNPVEAPKSIGREESGMIYNCPILMDY